MSGGCPRRVPRTLELCNSRPVAAAAGPAPVPRPTAPRPGLGRVWRHVPGRGSEASVPAAPAPGGRPPARRPACPGREAAQGRPDRTGRDAGGAATSEPRQIPGRPAGGRGRRSFPKPCRAPPPAGRRGLLQVPEKAASSTGRGASHGPTTPTGHSADFLLVPRAEGTREGQSQSLAGACQGSEPAPPKPTLAIPSHTARLQQWPPMSGLPLSLKRAELEPPSLPDPELLGHLPEPTCHATLDCLRSCPQPSRASAPVLAWPHEDP